MAAGKGALAWVCLGRNPECHEAWVAHGAPPALKNPSIPNGLYRRRSGAGSLLPNREERARREEGEHREHPRLAVRERTVPVPGVGPVGAKETVQRLARETLRGPRHLRARARPGPRARGREHPLDERPVDPRVVRHDEARALDERARRLDVNPLPAYVVVREARQVRDFSRERAARIVAVRLRLIVQDLDDGSREGVREQ